MDDIAIQFKDAELRGRGKLEVERAALYGDNGVVVQKGDVLYIDLDQGSISMGDSIVVLAPGEYVVVRGGLYQKAILHAAN